MARRKRTVRNSSWFQKRGIERRGRKRPVAFQSSGKGPNLEVLVQTRSHIRTAPFSKNLPLDPLQPIDPRQVQTYVDRHKREKLSIVENSKGQQEKQDNCPPQIRTMLIRYWNSEFHHGFEQWHCVILKNRIDGNSWVRLYFHANRCIFVKYHYGKVTRSREYRGLEDAKKVYEAGIVNWKPGQLSGVT